MRIIFTAAAIGLALAVPAHALDLNAYRRAHHRPPLAYSSELAAAAQWHANDLARRNRLDHNGFRERLSVISSTAAENVAFITCARPDAKPVPTFAGRACGCASESCVIRMWARSSHHRRNMLMREVSRYGLASARSDKGRVYWVLELGN